MDVSVLINNFSAGELSPLFLARIDTNVYNYGAKRIENFLPMLTGGLTKRPGTWYDGTAPGFCRLLPFQLNDRYVIVELSDQTARIWTHQFQLFGAPLELPTPYSTGDLPLVRYAVSNNSMYLVHPLYPPQKITWNYTTFALTTPTFTGVEFGSSGNYPSIVFFHAGRLGFAATLYKPNSVFLSKAPDAGAGTDRYTDFIMGYNAADAIYLQENDMYGSNLKWVFVNKQVIAGTDRTLWIDNGDVPTPATFDMNILSYSGVTTIPGVCSKDVLVYIGRNGRSLHALIQSQEGIAPTHLSRASDHLFIGGVVEICAMDFPYPVIWILLTDGTLASCTLDSGVISFAHHDLGGTVESIAIGPAEKYDVLSLSVNRNGTRCIEHLQLEDLINTPIDESHFVDSGKRYTYATPTVNISGLNHLVGQTVDGVGDGKVIEPVIVGAGGTVTLEDPVQKLHIGLPYESLLEPTSPEVPANGTSIGKKKQIEKALIRLYRSAGGKMGPASDNLYNLPYEYFNGKNPGDAGYWFTGDIDVPVGGVIDPSGAFMVKHTDPLPFNLLALILKIRILEV